MIDKELWQRVCFGGTLIKEGGGSNLLVVSRLCVGVKCWGGLGVLGLSYKVVWQLWSGNAKIAGLRGWF